MGGLLTRRLQALRGGGGRNKLDCPSFPSPGRPSVSQAPPVCFLLSSVLTLALRMSTKFLLPLLTYPLRACSSEVITRQLLGGPRYAVPVHCTQLHALRACSTILALVLQSLELLEIGGGGNLVGCRFEFARQVRSRDSRLHRARTACHRAFRTACIPLRTYCTPRRCTFCIPRLGSRLLLLLRLVVVGIC